MPPRPTLDGVQRRNLVIDAAVAGLVFGVALGTLASAGFGTPDPRARGLDALGVVLAAASALPLAARRLAPLSVYLVTAVASLALLRLGYPLDAPVGASVAAYTLAVAYGNHPQPLRRWLMMLAVGAFVPLVAVNYAAAGFDVPGLALELLTWLVIFAGLWIAGDRTRLRHERITELEEQARRAEREAERERRLAAAEERIRIARELHDSAGHAINVILVQAGAARLLHERDPAGSRRAIVTVEKVARDTIGEIDRLVRALRDGEDVLPGVPADPAALDELLERHGASGLDIATDVRGVRRSLPRGVAWAAYRILQEALTNAARHGRGSADVGLFFSPDAVEITVTNPTGSGGGAPRAGHGIVGMRERASLLGGTLDTGVDQGIFRLRARLPYSEATA